MKFGLNIYDIQVIDMKAGMLLRYQGNSVDSTGLEVPSAVNTHEGCRADHKVDYRTWEVKN